MFYYLTLINYLNNMPSLNQSKSWSDINIEQFVEIFTYPTENETEFLINRLGVILNLSNDEVEDLEYEEYINIVDDLKWSEQHPTKKPLDTIKVNDIEFHLIKDLNIITIGEFIDLEYFFQDGYVKNLTTVLSILYRPIKALATPLYPVKYDNYDFDPRYRAELFNDLSVDKVFGCISYYIKWRNQLLTDYKGLFNQDSSEDNEISDEMSLKGLSGVEKAEMLKAIEEEKKQKKWSWTLFLYALADNDALKLDVASKLPILGALNIYSMRQELNMKDK